MRSHLIKLLPLSLALCLLSASTCLADSPSACGSGKPVKADVVLEGEVAADYPLLPEGKELAIKPQRGLVYQLDTQPLGDRKPLLLVHGGQGETQPFFRWQKVVQRLEQDEDFHKQYKLYFFRYDSKDRLDRIVPDFRQSISNLYKASGNRPVRVLALSLGGNVAQWALTDPDTDSAVDLVMAMGTPFHGSPLFSSDWFEYSLNSSRLAPWSRALHNLDYKLYFNRHKNYLEDLKWDNVDAVIPDLGKFKARLPGGPKGILTPERDANPKLANITTSKELDKSKFVTYAGYLLNPYILSGAKKKLENMLLAPYTFITVRIPVQLGREHPALKMLNSEMSKLAVNPNSPVENPHLYDLNDGITPVGSAIFLPPHVMKTYPVLHEQDLNRIKYATDVRLARVFRNIDHVTFVEGNPPHHGSKFVRDELHPEHGEKLMLDWILYDLMQTPSAVAANIPQPAAADNAEATPTSAQ